MLPNGITIPTWAGLDSSQGNGSWSEVQAKGEALGGKFDPDCIRFMKLELRFGNHS